MEYYPVIKRMKYWYMDKNWKHYATWKKLDTEVHMLYDSISMKYPEQINPLRLNRGWWMLGDSRERREWEETT